MTTSSEFVGDRLRRLRELRRLSQMAEARRAGLSWSTVYRAEVGGVVTRRTAERLAPILGTTPEELLGLTATAPDQGQEAP
jgi:transcriptional regulator with XRE-family HTH domain